MEKEEATLLIEIACFQVNGNEDLYLCQNDILVLTFQRDSLASTSSPLHNINLLITKLKVYHTEIQLVMEQTFLKDWRRYAPGNLRKMCILKRVI